MRSIVGVLTGAARHARCARHGFSLGAIVSIAPSEDAGPPFAGVFVAAR